MENEDTNNNIDEAFSNDDFGSSSIGFNKEIKSEVGDYTKLKPSRKPDFGHMKMARIKLTMGLVACVWAQFIISEFLVLGGVCPG